MNLRNDLISLCFKSLRELVVARDIQIGHGSNQSAAWELYSTSTLSRLPPHPNIVEMYTAFADYVPQLRGALGDFPAALPARLNPHGLGRNMSLFLVMKRYDCSLRSFLEQAVKQGKNSLMEDKTPLILLAQLLEGVLHICLCC